MEQKIDWNKVKMCAHHKPHKLGYLAFHEYAEGMEKKGITQTQCPVCLYWFFPNEMGKPKKLNHGTKES